MSCKGRTRLLVVALATLAALLSAPSADSRRAAPAELLAPGAGYGSPQGSQPRCVHVQPCSGRWATRPARTTASTVPDRGGGAALPGGPGPRGGRGDWSPYAAPLRGGAHQAAQGSPRTQVAGPCPAGRERSRAPCPQPRERPTAARRPGLAERPNAVARGRRGRPGARPAVVVLWRLAGPRQGPKLGPLVCAALLATYAVGAATGAVFASHATPDRAAKPSAATAEPGPR